MTSPAHRFARRAMAAFAAAAIAAVTIMRLGAQAPSSPAPSADSLLAAAMKQAQAENKNVLVDFFASWCVPCLRLHAFLDRPESKTVLERHFVRVSFTVLEYGGRAGLNTPGAEELLLRWQQDRGVPFVTVLDHLGNPLGNGNGLGFDDGRHMVELLGLVAPRMTESERRLLASNLGETPASLRATGTRLVWEASPMYRASMSPDGRRVAYAYSGKVIVHDLDAGSDRPISRTSDATVREWSASAPVFSRDGKWVAYSWRAYPIPKPPQLAHIQLHVVPLDGPLADPPRVLASSDDIVWITAGDWSPDGRHIAVTLGTADDLSQIALISIADGSRRLLASFDEEQHVELLPDGRRGAYSAASRLARDSWTDSNRYTMRYSPDGRHLAFDIREPKGPGRDVFSIAIDTGRLSPVAVRRGDDALVGWTPDGQYVLVTSDRSGSGSTDLWAVPFRNDAAESAVLIKSSVGELVSVGATTSDGIFFQALTGQGITTLQTQRFDFTKGEPMTPPADVASDVRIGRMAWSGDGREIAYLRLLGAPGRADTIGILSVDTGRFRVLTPELFEIDDVPINWLPGRRAVAVEGLGWDGRWGTYAVDPDTGATTFVASGSLAPSRDGAWYFGLADGVFVRHDPVSGRQTEVLRGRVIGDQRIAADSALYYQRFGATPESDDEIVARDLTFGTDRTLFRARGIQEVSETSPDGRYLVVIGVDTDQKRFDVLIPTDGSAPRRMPYLGQPINRNQIAWAPDGQSYVTTVRTQEGQNRSWWIPIDGRPPRPIEHQLFPSPSPDGLVAVRVAAPSRPMSEIWVINLQIGGGGK